MSSAMQISIRGKCTTCGRVYEMTPEQRREAREFGCAMSPCCMAPAIVSRVEVKPEKAPGQRR